MVKEINKLNEKWRKENCDSFEDDIPEEQIRKHEQMVLERNKRAMRYGCELALAYKEIASDYGLIKQDAKRTFMITIRPDTNKINFATFKNDVDNFLTRTMFHKIHHCSFEQKGTSLDTLGHGFHVHIISETTCRSKGEVLRNTISTFKRYTADNCIQVDVCKNPEETIQNYLIDYKSKDGHKEITKEWDARWREQVGLTGAVIKSSNGPIIIELE